MIKYIKTIHSHTVAETSLRKVYSETNIEAGTICQLSNGYLVHSAANGKPYYLVIEDKNPDDKKMSVDCIRLLPGMVLMATFDPDSVSLSVGSLCGFDCDINEHYTTLSSTGTCAEVIGIDGTNATIIIN